MSDDREAPVYVRFDVFEAGEIVRAMDDLCGVNDFTYAEIICERFAEAGDHKREAFWSDVVSYVTYMAMKDDDTPVVISDDPEAKLEWEK